MVYGVLGLVGFLAQMVLGVNARLLPLFSWLTTAGWALFAAVGLDGFGAVWTVCTAYSIFEKWKRGSVCERPETC